MSPIASGLIKGDWWTADVQMLSAGVRRDIDGDTWGVKGEIGYRWNWTNWYIEPIGDVDWVEANVNNLNTFGGASFHFSDETAGKGEIGARVGGQWGSIKPWIGAYWVGQFSGDNRMQMFTGAGQCIIADCFSVTDTHPGDYGRMDFGFSVMNWNGLNGYLKGDWLFGNNTGGYAVRLGVSWKW
jgi:outer membrane autotransporter protein